MRQKQLWKFVLRVTIPLLNTKTWSPLAKLIACCKLSKKELLWHTFEITVLKSEDWSQLSFIKYSQVYTEIVNGLLLLGKRLQCYFPCHFSYFPCVCTLGGAFITNMVPFYMFLHFLPVREDCCEIQQQSQQNEVLQ